ncbi:zona pellucida sperm-binding protein 4-like [Perca fluviatilis]|uniref:zona pellucida sperm-binding protein 4-like n=1 Tax=Perca fluviatilis TaxID=8168 RepID=UPI001966BD44|nr:zona pellucida sperm-binding protein 4-like [Perca fluviatilis]
MLKPVALLLLLAGVVHTVPHPVCTVTASTVIDFFNRIRSVPDRCTYTLTGDDTIELLASFRERSRTDVPFLDALTITAAGLTIYLGQGGIVQVNGQTLTLNATAQLISFAEFSKDQTGATVQIGSSLTISFDGNTAVITGVDAAAEGLCGNPINASQTFNLAEEKSSSSVFGCEVLYSDTPNNTTNCNLTTEHCNLLMQAPFTDCQVDPAPYITACAETSCKFPTEEGLALSCQFLDAYAKTCGLNTNITLGDWRSLADCPVPQVSCTELYCSDNEYCDGNNGEPQCLCRALFAAKYTPTNSLGDPTVCMGSSATLTLAGCLLSAKNIDYTTLRLLDESCVGHMDSETHMVTFSFDSSNTCGTEIMNNGSQIIYQNAITMQNSSTDVITRHDQVSIDFSCLYTVPDLTSVSFKIKESSVVEEIVSGIWNYTLMMKAYTDNEFVNLVGPDTELVLDQKVWVELMTEGLDNNMVSIVTDSCWATNQPSPNASLRYDLVINGCPNPADQTVSVQGNGLGTFNVFSFNMFQFSGKAGDIYLHCQLELCPKHGNSCAQICSRGGRRRRSLRSKRADENPALITMAWNN